MKPPSYYDRRKIEDAILWPLCCFVAAITFAFASWAVSDDYRWLQVILRCLAVTGVLLALHGIYEFRRSRRLALIDAEYRSREVIEPEEGGCCPECRQGTLAYPRVRGCSCHISPPCSACTDSRLACEECGWEEPEPEPLPPPTQEERDGWARYQREWEEARQRGTVLPSGGRIFNVSYDSTSGSTMVFTGQYEGPVTAAEIFSHLGDGTFGHRGPHLREGRFTYTKITD